MSDIAEDVAEERRQIDDMLSPVKVKASHVGAPSLDGDSEEQVAASPCPSCSKVGAEVPLGGAGFHPSCRLARPPCIWASLVVPRTLAVISLCSA